MRTNRIAGVISGGKQAATSVFVPEIHSSAQSKFVSDTFRRNGFIG